jgi:2-keto-4-pentenoate hydratase/2-oxohepta-3-ene-1,7-dioic acid hydratase in catechol pathway
VTSYSLVTFAADGGAPQPGLRIGDGILPLTGERAAALPGADTSSVLGLLESWEAVEPALDQIAGAYDGSGALALEAVTLGPPVRWPRAIFCASANYNDHVQEWTGSGLPDKSTTRPCHFLKLPYHTLVGPEDVVHIPRPDARLFNEIELAVVIGKPARMVSEARAMDSVAGYTIFNDVSDYSQSGRSDWYGKRFGIGDWLRIKSFDNSSVLGPNLVPAGQVDDPYKLGMSLFVNDELMQESSTELMHYSIAEQISYLSEQLTLQPGDVISTGSIRGIGAVRGIFLNPGDRVRARIDGLGEQHTVIGAPLALGA